MSRLFKTICVIALILFFFTKSDVALAAGPDKGRTAQPCFGKPLSLSANYKRVESHACAGYFQLFYFPVMTDSRSYTIEVVPLDGDVDLYASRFKKDVDSVKGLKKFTCKGHERFCDVSLGVGSRIEAVTFSSPAPPEETKGYNSWFAVYAKEDAIFSARVVSVPKGQLAIAWNTSGTYTDIKAVDPFLDRLEIFSDENTFQNNTLKTVLLPDNKWKCDNCSKHYIGVFGTKKIKPIEIAFSSDDGLWLDLNNGLYVGHWGGAYQKIGCVNAPSCGNVQDIAPIIVSNELVTKQANVIHAQVSDAMQYQLFDLTASVKK